MAALLTCYLEQYPKALGGLSKRECEALHHFLAERSFKEMAFYMGISENTAYELKRRAMLKLGLTNNVALVKFAVRNGLENWLSEQVDDC